ncbi:MAG: hypothetical protein QOJ41_2145 [Acidobacteriaceae bacterium]|jgi:hypothetical protein|nr:hypothetical protein [Acidobacteriaceae bacterium]
MNTSDATLDKKSEKSSTREISLDTWAVLAAFLAALLIRFGVLKHIPW